MRASARAIAVALAIAAASMGCRGGGAPGRQAPGQAAAPKRGVAYGFKSVADLGAVSPPVTWWYNWSPRPDAPMAGDASAEFVPMVWGGSFDDDQLLAAIPHGSRFLLTFNEPNFHSQANVTAAQAAALWPRLEAIADARGLKLVSPAVNFCGPASACNETDPFAYLEAFFAACPACRVDYVAAHWYACSGDALSWYLGQLKRFGRPIWLTEFACGDGSDLSTPVQQQYMSDGVAILEADPDVFRYAWFSGRTSAIPNVNLLGAEGELTSLGQEYVALPAAGDGAP